MVRRIHYHSSLQKIGSEGFEMGSGLGELTTETILLCSQDQRRLCEGSHHKNVCLACLSDRVSGPLIQVHQSPYAFVSPSISQKLARVMEVEVHLFYSLGLEVGTCIYITLYRAA